MKTSNQKGFSSHFIFPLVAILVVAGIGAYVMLRPSSASSLECNNRTVNKSPVMCYVKVLPPTYADKTYYSKTQITITKRTSSDRTVVISPKKITYKNVGSKHATVTTTPTSWKISCDTKTYKYGAYADAPYYRSTKGTKTLTIPKKLDHCIILSDFNYVVTVGGKVVDKVGESSYSSTVILK
jgi:hypothetical protein